MNSDDIASAARKGRHGGTGSRERRRQRRAIQRVAIERHQTWLNGARTGDPVRVEIRDLTHELDDLYAQHQGDSNPFQQSSPRAGTPGSTKTADAGGGPGAV